MRRARGRRWLGRRLEHPCAVRFLCLLVHELHWRWRGLGGQASIERKRDQIVRSKRCSTWLDPDAFYPQRLLDGLPLTLIGLTQVPSGEDVMEGDLDLTIMIIKV